VGSRIMHNMLFVEVWQPGVHRQSQDTDALVDFHAWPALVVQFDDAALCENLHHLRIRSVQRQP